MSLVTELDRGGSRLKRERERERREENPLFLKSSPRLWTRVFFGNRDGGIEYDNVCIIYYVRIRNSAKLNILISLNL